LGRITPSFRQLYEEIIAELRTELQAALVDLGHKTAFDSLLKEAWSPEQAAMGNSTLPTVSDKLNIMASIHNRKVIAALSRELKEKDSQIQALSLAKDCYSMKLELLTNATVVDDAIRFVSHKSKGKTNSISSTNEDAKEESNEPDYNEDKDQLEEEQEEESGEITTNQVF
jgi:hypothetical protein